MFGFFSCLCYIYKLALWVYVVLDWAVLRVCVQPFLQDMLQKQQECLKMQREAVKHRVRQLAARQSEIFVSSLIHYFGVPVPFKKSLRCDDA